MDPKKKAIHSRLKDESLRGIHLYTEAPQKIFRERSRTPNLGLGENTSKGWTETHEDALTNIFGKTTTRVPLLTETLDPVFVGRVVNSLLPVIHESPEPSASSSDQIDWSDDVRVSNEEMERAIRRLKTVTPQLVLTESMVGLMRLH